MIRACFGSLLILALLAGCDRSPLRGGSKIAEDVYWRLNALGDGERTPTDSDSVLVRVRVARPGAFAGSVYSTERWYGMGGEKGTSKYFARLREGDSATVMLLSGATPWKDLGATSPGSGKDTGWVTMELSMLKLRSMAGSRELQRAVLMARTGSDEQRILADFFSGSNAEWKQALGVYYVLDSTNEAGPRIQSGQLVTLAYTASFLDNGRVFDEEEDGLTFRLGDPDQVIKGLEAAAHLLPRNGGKGRFVISSNLAFGPKGSTSGIVPPWTPLLYEVRVVTVELSAAGPS
jgi:FKBP-type peptidyl-prolyl cis-trans isomerase